MTGPPPPPRRKCPRGMDPTHSGAPPYLAMGDAGCAPWTEGSTSPAATPWQLVAADGFASSNSPMTQTSSSASAAACRLLSTYFNQFSAFNSGASGHQTSQSLRRVWRRYSATGGVSTSANAASSSADATHPSCCVCAAAATPPQQGYAPLRQPSQPAQPQQPPQYVTSRIYQRQFPFRRRTALITVPATVQLRCQPSESPNFGEPEMLARRQLLNVRRRRMARA